MSIARTKKTANYTTISNALIADKSLSWRAKGIAVYLLSKPDDWQIIREDIEQYATDGIASVRAGLKELEDAGYLTRTRKIGAHGHFEWDIVLHEAPQPSAENQPVEQPPSADLPPVVNPPAENPPAENRTLLNTDVLKTDLPMTDNQKSEGVDDLTETSQPPAPTPTLAQADVDEFVNATNLPAHAPSPTSGAPPSRIVLTDSPSGPKTVPRVNGVVTSRFFDPRKLVDGLIPEGSGTNPVEVFLEFFEIGPNGCGLTKPQMKALGEAITDLDKWRGVCKTVSLRNGKAYNIENMLDIYLNGFRKESVRHDDRKQLATAEERTAAIIAKRPELAAYAHFK